MRGLTKAASLREVEKAGGKKNAGPGEKGKICHEITMFQWWNHHVSKVKWPFYPGGWGRYFDVFWEKNRFLRFLEVMFLLGKHDHPNSKSPHVFDVLFNEGMVVLSAKAWNNIQCSSTKDDAMDQSKGWSLDHIWFSRIINWIILDSNRLSTLVMDIYQYLSLDILQTMVLFIGLNLWPRSLDSTGAGIRHLLFLPGGQQLRSPAHLRSSRRGTKKFVVYHGETMKKNQQK